MLSVIKNAIENNTIEQFNKYIENSFKINIETGEILKKDRYGLFTTKPYLHHSNNAQYLVYSIWFNNKNYTIRIQNLIWFEKYKKWPTLLIDHKDKNSFNNRIDNLREASYQENSQNKISKKQYSNITLIRFKYVGSSNISFNFEEKYQQTDSLFREIKEIIFEKSLNEIKYSKLIKEYQEIFESGKYRYNSNLGKVERKDKDGSWYIITGHITKSGYIRFRIFLNKNKTKIIGEHQAIYYLNHGQMPKSINHINAIKTDNRIENLEESNPQLQSDAKNIKGKPGTNKFLLSKRFTIFSPLNTEEDAALIADTINYFLVPNYINFNFDIRDNIYIKKCLENNLQPIKKD